MRRQNDVRSVLAEDLDQLSTLLEILSHQTLIGESETDPGGPQETRGLGRFPLPGILVPAASPLSGSEIDDDDALPEGGQPGDSGPEGEFRVVGVGAEGQDGGAHVRSPLPGGIR